MDSVTKYQAYNTKIYSLFFLAHTFTNTREQTQTHIIFFFLGKGGNGKGGLPFFLAQFRAVHTHSILFPAAKGIGLTKYFIRHAGRRLIRLAILIVDDW